MFRPDLAAAAAAAVSNPGGGPPTTTSAGSTSPASTTTSPAAPGFRLPLAGLIKVIYRNVLYVLSINRLKLRKVAKSSLITFIKHNNILQEPKKVQFTLIISEMKNSKKEDVFMIFQNNFFEFNNFWKVKS